MGEPTKPNVPTLSSDEIVQAANGVAAHAKARFLAGFADEAEMLAHRAAAIIDKIDTAAANAFRQLAARFGGHKVPEPTPAAPALRTDGPTPAEWTAAGYRSEDYPPKGYAPKPDAPPPVGT